MKQTLYHARVVVPMTPANDVIEDGAVVVGENGVILGVGQASQLQLQFPMADVVEMPNRLLMPGLINLHSHSGFLRGTAEGLPVWEWLQQFIDPMHRVLTEEDARVAAALCFAESLLCGTTTVVDMWRYMHGSAAAASTLGIRAVLVPYVAEHPDHDYFETLDSNEKLIRDWHGKADGRINVWVGMEHMFYANPQAWRRAMVMASQYDTGFHTHSNESKFDVEETQRRYGLRPIEALEKFGLLGAPRTMLAHCVWLSGHEIELLAKYNVGVAHNPISNMKLASGAAPVEDMLKHGVSVGLGTDGEKENNNLDMFEEMKVSSLLAKLRGLNAAALDAWSVCKMATINGARALGMDHLIGSLEVGKQADMIAIHTDTPRMTPFISGPDGNLQHNLVHAVRGGDVAMTMVAGKVVVADGKLLSGDLQGLIKDANQVAPALFARRAEWLARHKPINALEPNN